MILFLVAFEDVAGIDFFFHVVEYTVVAVGYDGLTQFFEEFDVVHDLAAEKGTASFQIRLFDTLKY